MKSRRIVTGLALVTLALTASGCQATSSFSHINFEQGAITSISQYADSPGCDVTLQPDHGAAYTIIWDLASGNPKWCHTAQLGPYILHPDGKLEVTQGFIWGTLLAKHETEGDLHTDTTYCAMDWKLDTGVSLPAVPHYTKPQCSELRVGEHYPVYPQPPSFLPSDP